MSAMVIQAGKYGSNYGAYSSVGGVGAAPGARSGGIMNEFAPRLQLTRRGRLVLLGIPSLCVGVVLMLMSMMFVFGSMAGPAHAAASYESVNMDDYARTVTVLQGESLWSIAAASNPHRNIREVVLEIVALNELGTGVVQAGQQLFVPIPK